MVITALPSFTVPRVAPLPTTRTIRRIEPLSRAFCILDTEPSGTISSPNIRLNWVMDLIKVEGSRTGPLVVLAKIVEIPFKGELSSTLLLMKLKLTFGVLGIFFIFNVNVQYLISVTEYCCPVMVLSVQRHQYLLVE